MIHPENSKLHIQKLNSSFLLPEALELLEEFSPLAIYISITFRKKLNYR
jgi:hypothetical protein